VSASTEDLDYEVGIDLRRFVLGLWAGRWWIAVSVVLFTVAFAAAAFLMTPVYRASVVLVAASSERGGANMLSSALGQLGGLASLAGINVGSGTSHMDEALAVLRSRDLTENFIRAENLMPELFAKRWDANARRWKGPPEKVPTLGEAFKYFDARVRSVTLDKRTGLATLQIQWRDPVKAAHWANALVDSLNAEMRARAISETKASVGYLEKELALTSEVETRQAISRLMEAQINQRMYANVTREYSLRVVDRALPADPRDISSPNKLLLLVLGPTMGFVFGAIAVIIAGALARAWKE
jgi:uncharacterized protein involved in exopolysaccharide biosynthesis